MCFSILLYNIPVSSLHKITYSPISNDEIAGARSNMNIKAFAYVMAYLHCNVYVLSIKIFVICASSHINYVTDVMRGGESLEKNGFLAIMLLERVSNSYIFRRQLYGTVFAADLLTGL